MGPIRVLVADDDADFARALVDLLDAEAGVTLIGPARDTEEVIALATRGNPHVVLLGARMPGGGGLRATKDILAADSGVRVIALSVSDDRAAVLEMPRAGASGYLVKGASVDEILAMIRREHLGQGALSSPAGADQPPGRRADLGTDTLRQHLESVVAGHGLDTHFQPIVELHSGRVVGYEA